MSKSQSRSGFAAQTNDRADRPEVIRIDLTDETTVGVRARNREWIVGIVAQFAAAASTTLVLFAVASIATAEAFGRLAVLVVGFQLAQSLGRATCGVLLGQEISEERMQTAQAVFRFQVLFVICVVVLTNAVYPAGSGWNSLGWLYGLGALASIFLEFFRSLFFARRAPELALRVDVIATGLFVLALLALQLSESASARPEAVVAAWGIVMWLTVGIAKARWADVSLTERHSSIAVQRAIVSTRPLLSDWSGSMVRAFVPTYALVFILLSPGLAGYRSAWLVLGFAQRAVRGVLETLLPQLRDSRSAVAERAIVMRAVKLVGFAMGCFVLVIHFLPDMVGEWILGKTWKFTTPLLGLAAISVFLRTPEFIGATQLLANKQQSRLAKLRVSAGLTELVFVVAGAFLLGALGAMAGHVVGALLASALVWHATSNSNLPTKGTVT